MKVDNNWHVGIFCGGGGEKEAELEVASGINHGIEGFDAIEGLFGGRSFEVEEVHDAVVDGAIRATREVDPEGDHGSVESHFPRHVLQYQTSIVGHINL